MNDACLLVQDMFLLAAMGPPGGGRTHISGRLQSRFNLINMTFPNVSLSDKYDQLVLSLVLPRGISVSVIFLAFAP